MRQAFTSRVSTGDINSKVVDRENLRGLSVISQQLQDVTKELIKMTKVLEDIKRKK